jgi:hypothetical protein
MAEVGVCLDKMHTFGSPHGTTVCGLGSDIIENSVLPCRRFARTTNPVDFHESINLWPPELETWVLVKLESFVVKYKIVMNFSDPSAVPCSSLPLGIRAQSRCFNR